ncbi:SEL1-like repeat protein [Lentisphaerota bacterium WC36G]|nr:SEL1-like repeat protein [Lentisphaerae bacterium WC36]
MKKNILVIFYIYLITFCLYGQENVKNDRLKNDKALRESAHKGNLTAQKKLAYEYFMGNNRSRNYKLAVYWFKKAAEQNDSFSKFNLAVCYSKGLGIKENKYLAFKLCEEVANDIPKAKYMLAQFYQKGFLPVNNDPRTALQANLSKASKLYEQLITKDKYADAYYSYAKMLLTNIDATEKDKEKAVKLLQIAIKNNDSHAMNLLADCYNSGDGVPQSFQKMFFWLKKSSLQNNHHAIARLAHCYYHGYGTKTNRKLAFKLFKHAAAVNEPMAMNQMGDFYAYGEFVEENLTTAVEWYKKAAEAKNTNAIYTLATFYIKGIYFKKDLQKAARLLHQGSLLNNSKAQYEFASMLLAGAGVKTNVNLAFYWFEKSALNNYAPAQRELAICFLNGIGTLKDTKKTLFWLKKAAENGDMRSKALYLEMLKNNKGE